MKNYLTLIAIAIIASLYSCQPKEKQSNAKNDIIGVYQYIDGREGMSVITDKYFIFAGNWKHEPSSVDSEDYYEKEYKSLFMEAGRYTMQDSIVSCYMLFGKNGKIPSQDGPSFRFAVSYKGDTLVADVLKRNGEHRGRTNYSIRLE